MSEEKSPHKGLTRRGFLKSSGTMVGTLGLAGAAGMTATDTWLASASAYAEQDETVRRIFHQSHCLGNCTLKCTVRDGRLALVEPNEHPDKRFRKICLRGISEVQHVYSTNRIQTPLKRVGARGEGVFEAIPWDEAIKLIADSFKDIQAKYGNDALLISRTTEAAGAGPSFLESLLKANTGGQGGIDRGIANGYDPAFGISGAKPGNSIWDWDKAATIINWGNNIVETGLVWSASLFDAKKNGAKIITVDPRFSGTAAKSDEWVPIKPATDAAFLLAMVHHIVESGLYDEEHVLDNTSLPFLVDRETGLLLGPVEEIDGKQIKTPMIWDGDSQTAKAYDAGDVHPVLEGAFDVDGIDAATEFTILREHIRDYSPEWASAISQVPAETIVSLAEDYATRGPAIFNFGFGGIDKCGNADVAGHAIALLVSLTGNIGGEGRGAGPYLNGGTFNSALLAGWKLPDEFKPSSSKVSFYDLPYKENNVRAAYFCGDVTLRMADLNAMLKWIDSLEFVVVNEIYHSAIVDWADVVIPECTKFESDEDLAGIKVANGALLLREKVIDPLFDSKTRLWIERALAREWGYDQYLPATTQEWIEHQLGESSKGLDGITLETLREGNCVSVLGKPDVRVDVYGSHELATPTKREEVYYENLIECNSAFPTYEEPDEVYDANPLREKYPLNFVQVRSRFRIHGQFSDATWIEQYYTPCVDLNPEEASARQVGEGDLVEVFNDRGSFTCRVRLTESIPPGSVFMVESTFSRYMDGGNIQSVTNRNTNPRGYLLKHGPTIPFNDTLVEVKKA